MIDLWPDDIRYTRLKAPVTILMEQASLLGKKTQNLLEAKVENNKEALVSAEVFVYGFYLVAPALSYYRYKLFTISHDIQLYPVKINIDSDILKEISPDAEEQLLAESEGDFLEILKKIFGAEKTRHIISALLAQVVDIDEKSSNRKVYG